MVGQAIGVWLRPEYCPAITLAFQLVPRKPEPVYPQQPLTPEQYERVIADRDARWALRDSYWNRRGVYFK